MLESLKAIDLESSTLTLGRFDRILVAVDESSESQPAFLHAIDLALVAQGSLVCAAVISPEAIPGEHECASKARVDEMRRTALAHLEQMAGVAAARGLAVECILLEGIATDAILEAAVARQATLIVIGAGQRRILERLVLGGSADHILRRRCLPVTVVRS